MKYMKGMLIAACLTGSTLATAQKQSGSLDSLTQTPPAAKERAKLHFLVGSYTTETMIPPVPMAPKGATGKGTSVITWGLDSMFVLIDEESANSLFGTYKGHGVLGFDPQARQFELFMYNNFGDHPSYKGNFVGDTLVLQARVPMPGKPFDQKLLWYKDGDAVKLKVMNDTGKGFALAIEQTATPVRRMPK